MKPWYRNAFEVFPKELVRQLQQHYVGLVYIPKHGDYYKHRAELIVRLSDKKASSREIAELCGLSRRRVNQILKQRRARMLEEDRKISTIDTPEFSW
ncbi:MAG TPA: helix-turn-helix domain-containing protein [Planctomycetota bacterium]|nr:helix-turn-helix domain-containing protein [Planctomycetota bacterium]HRT95304.1 helix-turn-helix domain-containing protein [Planctomycetota bacterium]